MHTSSRALHALALAALVSAVGCQQRQVGDDTAGEPGTQGRRDTAAVAPSPDTLGLPGDTLVGVPDTGMGVPPMDDSDTVGLDRSPAPGAEPPAAAGGDTAGGTTINFDERTATDAEGHTTEVGGVTEGGVTTREGAAAAAGGDAAAPEDTGTGGGAPR